MSETPRGPFTVWVDNGYNGWAWTDFETMDEALRSEKYSSNFVIQAPVRYKIVIEDEKTGE